MSVHAFVDESQRARYIICAAIISPDNLRATRSGLREMLLPRQRRLHFATESPQRRRSLLVAMAELPVRALVYTSSEREPTARQSAMAALLADLVGLKGQRLIIEHREQSQDRRERAQIAAAIRNRTAPAGLDYRHLKGHEEPLLWVADAVAWAYGAGREWHRRTAGLVDGVLDVDADKRIR